MDLRYILEPPSDKLDEDDVSNEKSLYSPVTDASVFDNAERRVQQLPKTNIAIASALGCQNIDWMVANTLNFKRLDEILKSGAEESHSVWQNMMTMIVKKRESQIHFKPKFSKTYTSQSVYRLSSTNLPNANCENKERKSSNESHVDPSKSDGLIIGASQKAVKITSKIDSSKLVPGNRASSAKQSTQNAWACLMDETECRKPLEKDVALTSVKLYQVRKGFRA